MLCIINIASAQKINTARSSENKDTKSIVINDQAPSLVMDYYSNMDPFERTFDYDNINRQRRLEMTSRLVVCGSVLLTLGIMTGGGILAVEKNWSLAWYIPTATAIGCGIMIGGLYWGRHINSKIETTQVAPIYSYEVSNNTSVSAVGLSVSSRGERHRRKAGVGVGVTKKF